MSWLRNRQTFEQEEREVLSTLALRSHQSLGRVVDEPPHPYRTAFQRDRDRIVHSRGFRRLEYKTQVFIHHEGDHYRNRLTHTLEAAQIARTIARVLRLNEELAEAIALAHDLGHTPFGHAGERVLAELLQDDGGFDHNRQTLRVVDILEERDPDSPGLNLTFETREGLLKHGCEWDHPVRLPPLTPQRSLEAQAADLADEIAYTNHDLDDGLRSGLITSEALADMPVWREAQRVVDDRAALLPELLRRSATIASLVNLLVTDLVEATAKRLEASAAVGVVSVATLRSVEGRFLVFSESVDRSERELKRFLLEHLYRHPRVLETTREAAEVVRGLYGVFRADAGQLPQHVRARFPAEGEARAVADYVAGMTDRFALAAYRRRVEPAGSPLEHRNGSF